MRWKALFLVLGLLAFVGIMGIFFLDSLVGWSIEHVLQTAIGAKVDIEHLHIDLFNLKVSIAKVQITNPNNTWRNLIETDGINFQMAWEPLFQGKIVIEDLSLADLMINTPRRTDGRIKKVTLPGPFGQAQRRLNQEIASLPAINQDILQKQIPVDKLMSSYQLKTELATVQIRQKIEATNLDWQSNLKKLPDIQAKLTILQNQFQQLQSAPQPQNLIEIRNRLQAIQDFQKSVTEIQTEIEKTTQNFIKDFDDLKTNITNLKGAAESDIHTILKMAKLPDFSSINISEILLGKGLLNESTTLLNMVDNIQKKIPVSIDNPPKENHPRGGQDIVFPGRNTYPKLLIKRIFISAKGTPASSLDGYYAQGAAYGITSEPVVYGKPMLLNVNAKASNHSYLDFNGSINHISPSINDQFALTIGNMPLEEIQFPETGLLPDQISTGKLNLNSSFQIRPENFQLVVTLATQGLKCTYAPKNIRTDLIGQLVQQTLTGMDQVTLEYRLEGVAKKLNMKISSNFDQLFNSRFNALIGAKVDQAKAEIQAKVQKVLLEKEQELETLRQNYQKNLESQIKQVQEMLNKQTLALTQEKQRIEDRINQQLSSEQQKKEEVQKKLIDKAKQELEKKIKLPKLP